MPQTPKSFQQVLQELWELLKAYAQQETLGPLKNLGRQIGFGLGGSLSFALGYFLITLGVMRLLQTHDLYLVGDFFRVHNYLVYLVGFLLLLVACVGAVLKARSKAAQSGSTPGTASPTATATAITPVSASPIPSVPEGPNP